MSHYCSMSHFGKILTVLDLSTISHRHEFESMTHLYRRNKTISNGAINTLLFIDLMGHDYLRNKWGILLQ